MSYTKVTNFATKDSLPSGDPDKIVKGSEINTEFNNIQTAITALNSTIGVLNNSVFTSISAIDVGKQFNGGSQYGAYITSPNPGFLVIWNNLNNTSSGIAAAINGAQARVYNPGGDHYANYIKVTFGTG